jgi:hypothetical protein
MPNTVTYERPVAGVTPPTSAQVRAHQQVAAVITGDGATTSFTVMHNMGIPAADLAAGFPEVSYEYLLPDGYTAQARVFSKVSSRVVFLCTAFAGAALRVVIRRPWSATK